MTIQKRRVKRAFSLRRLLENKRLTVVLSCLMAFAFWLVIMINQNPVRQQSFSDIPLNISLENTVAGENGMGIVGDTSTLRFTVMIEGPNYIVSSLKSDDFGVYASAAEVTEPGKYTLEVSGMRLSAASGYTFVSISPQTVELSFDYFDTKAYTVTPKLIGVGAAEGLVAETPVVSATESDTVTVYGPRSIMETIDSVVAYAEVNKTLSSSQTYDAQIQLFDAAGNEIDPENLVLSDTTVKVSVPISKRASIKVTPTFSNLPSGLSEKDIAYTLSSNSLNVIGTPDVISSMTALKLSAIDFREVSSANGSFDVEPDLPEGVKLLDSVEFVTVSIDVSGYAEKTVDVTNVKMINLSSSLAAKNLSSIKNVKICGPAEVIEALTAADVYAELDLSDKSEGEHSVEAVIKSESYQNVWQVGSYTATVRITTE